MELNKIILVTENWKGTETNMLLTFEDYKAQMRLHVFDTMNEAADAISDLYESLADKDHWGEFYYIANKSVSARFCNGETQLRQFLMGDFNSTDQPVLLNEERCSHACLDTLKAIGIGTDGRSAGIRYQYEPVERTFSQGEILHNLNGKDYRVIEKLSERNLLLMKQRSGEFIVAVGVGFFARFPKGELPTADNKIYGIEWNHGIYYGSVPSYIDFQRIREEYGEKREVKTLDDFRTEQSEKFYMLRKIMDSPLMEASVKEAAENSIYKDFATEKEDVFRNNLIDGVYDGDFFGSPEVRKDKPVGFFDNTRRR